MPAPSQDTGGATADERLERALSLMREALQAIDSLDEYPELGAKLNEVIESLTEEIRRPNLRG